MLSMGRHKLVPWRITILLLLLLLISTSQRFLSNAENHDNHDHDLLRNQLKGSPEQTAGGREERRLENGLFPLNIHDNQLLRYVGNVLENRAADNATTVVGMHPILAIAVSSDERTVYFSQERTREENSTIVLESVVRRAEIGADANGHYNISVLAGPWSILVDNPPLCGGDSKSHSEVSGMSILKEGLLVISRKQNNRVTMLNMSDGEEVNGWNVTCPQGVAKHPSQKALLVSAQDRINIIKTRPVPSFYSGVVQSLVGPDTNATDDRRPGFLDSQDRREVRFHDPLMGPQSLSRDGKMLYVLEHWSGAVRRVDTVTGATRTIARWPDKELHFSIKEAFNRSSMSIVTSNGCNLFVSVQGQLFWLLLQSPNRDAMNATIVAELKGSKGSRGGIMPLYLTEDDRHLYAGTGDGRIFKLEIIVSSLHKCADSKSKSMRKRKLLIGLMSGFVFLAVCLLVVTVCILCEFRKRRAIRGDTLSDTNTDNLPSRSDSMSSQTTLVFSSSKRSKTRSQVLCAPSALREYSLSTLETAISEGTYLPLTEGGSRHVYRASLMVGGTDMDVAIKVMIGRLRQKRRKQFRAEVNMLSKVQHRNLCKLLGYCMEGNYFILIYPLISCGSLYSLLHPASHDMNMLPLVARDSSQETTIFQGRAPLTWTERMFIARQIGTCLRYLHCGAEQPVVHGNVKSSNVLIEGRGKKLHAYLSDFALGLPGRTISRAAHPMTPKLSTDTISGTAGYMPPEYIYELKLTVSCDVFAFGVVLLELVTGLTALLQPNEQDSIPLCLWARRWQQVDFLFDNSLKSQLTAEEWIMAAEVLYLALRCTCDLKSERPSMPEVVQSLETIRKDTLLDSPDFLNESVSISEAIDFTPPCPV